MPQPFASKAPSLADLGQYDVNRANQYEAIRQSLYDYTTYGGAAGQTQLQFFQVPVGQSGKTLADTNMRAAGQLPQPQFFLLESIEIKFYPGVLPGTHVTTLAATEFANDVYTVAKSGWAELFIGSKPYLDEAPLDRFPPKTRLNVDAAYGIQLKQTMAADAEEQVSMDYATFSGRPYFMDPQVLLVPNQNFTFTLNWPTAVPLPSTADARIGVVFDGYLYRLSQ